MLKSRRRLIAVLAAIILLPCGWWASAYPRGMVAAWIDGLRGHDEVQTFGLPRGSSWEAARLLSTRYAVETNRVAGCVVSQDLVWYVRGYNSVARSRINARFGKDVFAECLDAAESAPESETSEK